MNQKRWKDALIQVRDVSSRMGRVDAKLAEQNIEKVNQIERELRKNRPPKFKYPPVAQPETPPAPTPSYDFGM